MQRQLAYYFSDKNLWRDEYLMKQLGDDGTGWVDIKIIAGFKRIQDMTSDVDLLASNLQGVDGIEVQKDEGTTIVRRTRPVPPAPCSSAQGESAVAESVIDEVDLQGASSCVLEGTRPVDASTAAPAHGEESTGVPGFRVVPKTGVIYVMDQAAQCGYNAATAHEWANLGQGSPETTQVENWPTSVKKRLADLVEKGKLSSIDGPWAFPKIEINEDNLHYSNVNGDLALRRAVAKLYNDLYRKGSASQYAAENVSIVGGGRLALTRLCAAMSNVNLGHFMPDYTAYAELLTQFKNINTIPILLDPENNFHLTLRELQREIVGRGLSVLLLSNPCNPTGQLIEGEELKSWVRIARETQCTMVFDEIYSRYIYTQRMSPSDANWRMVSTASFVEDVNKDPIVIIDGLTKCWRMPGLRICWIVGPKKLIDAVGAAGSFLDGGASLPTQRSIVPLLNPKSVIEQTVMLQQLFSHKRDFLLVRLQEMGINVESPPQGTFYCWCDVSKLPPPLDTCWGFFRELLKERVIVTPGVFFDVNPGQRRKSSRYGSYVRLSYGPSFKEVKRGLDGIHRAIEKHRRQGSPPSLGMHWDVDNRLPPASV